MARPVIGIIGNHNLINNEYEVHASGCMNAEAVAVVCDAVPLVVAPNPKMSRIADLLEICDGILLTGGRPNVHPEEYGEEATDAHGTFDRARDALVLPLVRACIDIGLPVLGICRGFQEVNVAMGGSLYPEIRDLPGRTNHRMPPDGTIEEKFALRHAVKFVENGPFHQLMGDMEVMTNTLHGQGVKVAGPRVVIDGVAPDGTPEALYIKDAPGFCMSVQWHPEYQAAQDNVLSRLFGAFGQAAAAWSEGERPAILRSA